MRIITLTHFEELRANEVSAQWRIQKPPPPFCTILRLRYPFLVTDPKVSLNAPSAPIYTNLKGGARAEKRRFLINVFQKVLKNAFFGHFFKKILPAAQKIN